MNVKAKGFVVLLVGLLFIATSARPLFAQTSSTGAIAGTVTDISGAVVPGATVVATNADTGQSRTVTTGALARIIRCALVKPGMAASSGACTTALIWDYTALVKRAAAKSALVGK